MADIEDKENEIKEDLNQDKKETTVDKKETLLSLKPGQDLGKQLTELVEKEIKNVLSKGIKMDTVEYLSLLVDIHKDIQNEEYWKDKKEVYQMRYSNYSGYSNYPGDMNENYGRRGVPGSGRGRGRSRYRGESENPTEKIDEMMEELMENYTAFADSKEDLQYGNYGAEQNTMRNLDYMLKAICGFIDTLQQEASSAEEMQLIRKYIKKLVA